MPETLSYNRSKAPKSERMREALLNPSAITREINNRSLYQFLQYFWPMVSPHAFQPNWHIEYLCYQLELMAERVAAKKHKKYDLIINVPPGTTKTITCSIMFPVWCWTKWYWMRFITASYSSALALESAEYSRELIRSQAFQDVYPDLMIKEDKDTKSNFKIVKKVSGIDKARSLRTLIGGGRYSTSVGGTLMGFHGDILIVDDPLNPTQAASEVELANANRWVEQTLSTRKTNKAITPTILIMQRLHQDDPSGHMLAKQKTNIKHISLPGQCRDYKDQVKPASLIKYYKKDLMDPNRMSWKVLADLEADLGQYGFAGQIGQNPSPPGGGMFKVDRLIVVDQMPPQHHIISTVRAWDKAGTADGGAYTSGVKMTSLLGNRWIIEDVIRGRWSSDVREKMIKQVAHADGAKTKIWIEQEPGSSGKESAEGTVRNLAGFVAKPQTATGDKVTRADPLSVQVNVGSILLLRGDWNRLYTEELRFFPFSTYKDQVDSSSLAFSKLVGRKVAKRVT